MNKKFSKILYIILLIILIPILLINLIIMIKSFSNKNEIPSVLGVKPMIVLSGSMEPNINKGDLVLVKSVNYSSLKVGDIISFRDADDAVITHRIISLDYEDGKSYFTTQGDANNAYDNIKITESNFEGLYFMKIPKLGSYLQFIQTPIGIVIVVMGIIIIAFVLIMLSNNFQKDDDVELRKEFEEFKKKKSNK